MLNWSLATWFELLSRIPCGAQYRAPQRGVAWRIDYIAELSAGCNRVRQFEDRHGANVILESLSPLAGLSLASVVIRTAERVAAADRKIHRGEQRALHVLRPVLTALPARC
jgi:hypothetical protein